MLPPKMPAEGWLLADGSSEACQQVGGDYFDVIQLSPDHWATVLADVSGKGVSAALLTSLIQGAFFATATLDAGLSEVVARINNYICERSRSAKFATVFYSVIERDGLCSLGERGSLPDVSWSAPGVKSNPSNQPVSRSGCFPTLNFHSSSAGSRPATSWWIYSDGVSEAQNFSAEQFRRGSPPRKWLPAMLPKCREKLFQTIQREINSFTAGASQRDDLTLLVLGYQG